MNTPISSARGRGVIGVMAVALLAYGLTMHAAAADRDGRAKASPTVRVEPDDAGVKKTGSSADKDGVAIRIGPGIPRNLAVPVLPPEIVDYRNDGTTRAMQAGQPIEP